MGLLDGKNIVITGVLTDASLAFGVATLAQEEGADIVLTGAGRALSLTERVARKLPKPVDVYELDVTVPDHLDTVRDALRRQVGPSRRRAALHRLRPEACLGDDFMVADVGRRVRRHAHQRLLVEGPRRCLRAADDQRRIVRRPRLRQHRRLAGVQLDGRRPSRRSRASAAISPWRSAAGRSAPTWSPPARSRRWPPRASPASRSSKTSGTTAPRSVGTSPTPRPSPRRASCLLSDWFPATTGEIIHVDGGYHATGA